MIFSTAYLSTIYVILLRSSLCFRFDKVDLINSIFICNIVVKHFCNIFIRELLIDQSTCIYC